ncbi:MAG TPA: zf-TFIIB domain-containing protein [Candidatus Bathyarchaeia archaeon]|nr:zf-TFIIB domain-containing protein [Candidatus Bathyarchaeia archaeon]
MDCPVCKEPMVVIEHASVEVDYCVKCQGIWLDSGELELLMGNAETCAAYLRGGKPAATKEAVRRCPICGKKMEKAVTQGAEPVMYDRCARGDGLWFDKGELEAVLRDGGNVVADFLREVFPKGD